VFKERARRLVQIESGDTESLRPRKRSGRRNDGNCDPVATKIVLSSPLQAAAKMTHPDGMSHRRRTRKQRQSNNHHRARRAFAAGRLPQATDPLGWSKRNWFRQNFELISASAKSDTSPSGRFSFGPGNVDAMPADRTAYHGSRTQWRHGWLTRKNGRELAFARKLPEGDDQRGRVTP